MLENISFNPDEIIDFVYSLWVEKGLTMLTIIIPAYNEANCIKNTLSEYDGIIGEKLEVIVIPNGCNDNTAEVVKMNFPHVSVIELEEGSKTLAINKGIEIASNKNILVQDADVIIRKYDVKRILDFIENEIYLFASPVPIFESTDNFWVKKYYNFLSVTPVYKLGMVSSGVYLLSPKAIEIIGFFPHVIADDGYVKGVLGPYNLTKISNCYSMVKLPKDLWSLIKIKTRSRLGNLELAGKYISPSTGGNSLLSLIKIGFKNRMLSDFFIYAFVTFGSLVRAKKQLNNKNKLTWERDESTRQ